MTEEVKYICNECKKDITTEYYIVQVRSYFNKEGAESVPQDIKVFHLCAKQYKEFDSR